MTTTAPDPTEIMHAVPSDADAIFTWDYARTRDALGKLYEKAKTSQWNVTTDLDWSIDVDPEKVANETTGNRFSILGEVPDSPLKNWGKKEWSACGVELWSKTTSASTAAIAANTAPA